MAEAEEDSDSHSIAGPRAGLFPGLRRPTRRPRPPRLAAASPRVSPWLLSNAVRGAHGPRSRYIAITLCFLLATAYFFTLPTRRVNPLRPPPPLLSSSAARPGQGPQRVWPRGVPAAAAGA